ncbi:carbohydrate ABC transporter permease [Haloarchaeobius litoreus]|uniref:Carbohydrate ABC transporter permease n=1 Tax=Haloarchaeobius litoreus TaxID=755306 RepID=A0ABD6DHZ2_9EURY|nr:sugar ABC transporter permease [Haloarchaeobius litoreus]
MSTANRLAQRARESSVTPWVRDNVGLFLVLPGLFLFSAFMFYPVLYLLYLSFTKATNAPPASIHSGNEQFIGLENYVSILADPSFWNSMGVTWLFVATSVVLKLAFGIVIALVLTGERVRGQRFLRSLVILPMGLPAVFSITVWSKIFDNARYSLSNKLLLELGLEKANWMTERWLAFFTYNVTEVWLAYPFIVIITVSALQDVPEELHDAAKVDGAGYVHRFRHVTLPAIRRPVMFGGILTSAASFQQFLIPFIFNDGGPGSANSLLIHYGYTEAFGQTPPAYGRAASIMMLTLLFIGAFMWLNVKKGKLAEGVDER